jgi:hypothetical protein
MGMGIKRVIEKIVRKWVRRKIMGVNKRVV